MMNGKYVDVNSPIGEPFDDYTCAYDAGYEITLHNVPNHAFPGYGEFHKILNPARRC